MNLTTYSLSAIRTPTATYPDSFYKYNQSTVVYEQGFYINKIEALTNVYDSSINNYTAQYLTGYRKLGDFITPQKKNSVLRTITTPLIINNLSDTSQPKVLNINIRQNGSFFTILDDVNYENNGSFFELEIINDRYLRVLHNTGSGYLALNVLSGSYNVSFDDFISTSISISSNGPDIFKYTLDENGYLQLIKNIESNLYLVCLEGSSLVLQNILSASKTRTTSLFKIYYNYSNIEPKLKSSWVSYDTAKQNTLFINPLRSNLDKSNQYLLHTNYNEITDSFTLNYLTLDNNRSEKGFIKRGTSMTVGDELTPGTVFREYTTLRTGNDQEGGDDHISLSYVWYDKDIFVYSGKDTYFTTPSSLYPYDRLNINDTKFTQNGSLGANTPLFADKIKSVRSDGKNFNNGRYLFTWLRGGDAKTPGVWVDRYYYPDRLSKLQTLTSIPVYTPSFYDPIDSLQYPFRDTQSLVFDKKSDLTLEPNTKYVYTRSSEQDIRNALSNLTPIINGFDNYYSLRNTALPCSSANVLYDGTKYNKFNIKKDVNCSSQFTIAFDLYIEPGIWYGYSIANSDREFSILNDIKITPFITLQCGNKVYMYNTDFVLINTVTFESDVKEVILDKSLQDFFVVCTNNLLYKVNGLGNKIKLEMVPIIGPNTGYKNYTQDSKYLYFLVNTAGKVLRVDKNTFYYDFITSTPLQLYVNDKSQKQRGLIIYNNILYSTPGETVKFITAGEIYYLVNNKELWYYNLITNKVKLLFGSGTSINDFDITVDNKIIILTNNKWYIYTTDRELVTTGTTTAFATSSFKSIHIDTVREHTDTGIGTFTTVLALTGSNMIDSLSGDLVAIKLNTGEVYNLGLSGTYFADVDTARFKYAFTNYNRFKPLTDYNISFNMTLNNYLSSEDIFTSSINVDLTDLSIGYHKFTYRFDAAQGNISLFVDGDLYKNQSMPPGKYQLQQIFKEDLYFGAVGITNGIDLATHLKQPGYYISNHKNEIRNLVMYSKALSQDEVFALNFEGKKVDDLVLSVPYGQRNNFEEIERYFKYSPVTSSKSINIYVKNTKIANSALKSNIKNAILEQVTSTLPVGVKVNDIEFIDFNNDTV